MTWPRRNAVPCILVRSTAALAAAAEAFATARTAESRACGSLLIAAGNGFRYGSPHSSYITTWDVTGGDPHRFAGVTRVLEDTDAPCCSKG
jgi:hypothetical protein